MRETPHNNIGVGEYNYGYELSDGQARQESAQLVEGRSADTNEPIKFYRVTGSYSWVNPIDGKLLTVTYVADENGYRAEGEHLPTV